jgi:uncharacterized glyoxalase superfamily protein PhnB
LSAERKFAALAEVGQVPLTMAFFSRRLGLTADRFGASWMVLAC